MFINRRFHQNNDQTRYHGERYRDRDAYSNHKKAFDDHIKKCYIYKKDGCKSWILIGDEERLSKEIFFHRYNNQNQIYFQQILAEYEGN